MENLPEEESTWREHLVVARPNRKKRMGHPRDNDGKYQKGFDEIFKAASYKVKPIPPRSPNCQAHVERVIQTYQHECLDQFVIVGERQMNYISREFQSWYNFQRPHSSVNSLPPADQTMSRFE